MTRVAAIGDPLRLAGYALSGVEVHPAADAAGAAAAWERLHDDVACVILSESAHAALADRLAERPRLVWAVLPR